MFRRKALQRLLYSSLMVAILPLVTILLLTRYMMTNVEMRENMLHETTTSHICSVVEYTMETACNTSHIIAQNSAIRDYIAKGNINYWTEHQLAALLSETVAGLQYIEDCFVYMEPFDRVLSVKSNHQAPFYFHSYSTLDPDMLINAMRKGYTYALLARDEQLCAFTKMFDQYDQVIGYCVIQLDLPEMLIEMAKLAPTGTNAITLSCNQMPLISNMEAADLNALLNQNGRLEWQRVPTQREVSYIRHCSIYGNLISVLLIRSQGEYIDNSILGIWLFCVLFTLALCVSVSYFNYKPIQKISTIIHDRQPAVADQNANEYQMIETSLLDYERQVEWLSEKIRSQNERFRSYYLEKLLLKQTPPKESVRDILSFFGMSFYHKDNFVCIAEASHADGTDPSSPLQMEEDEVMINLFELMKLELQSNESVYRLQIDGRWVFVCSVQNRSAYQQLMQESVCKINQDTGSCIEMHEGLTADCGEKLWESYFDALQQIEPLPEEILTDSVKRTSDDSRKDYSNQCIELIHQRYGDETLNAEALADACGVTLAYLSKLFKKEVGMGLLEYLQRYRIDCAKKQLAQNPDIRINALCENVGYSNVATFIRVFKKYEGISPGIYRDQMLKKQL